MTEDLTKEKGEGDSPDLWFKEQVAIALIQADSSNATWIKSETVRARMKIRAEMRKSMNELLPLENGII